MEWLWLFLSIVGLGLLWLLIMGVEKLTERLKAHDEARRQATAQIAKRTAEAESVFLARQNAKAYAKDFIENADFNDQSNPDNDAMIQAAVQTLSTAELLQSVSKRVFGAPKGTDGITAKRSAFDQTQPKKVVAKGEGVTPVKVKPSAKPVLSKSEQKMLKKIKQGD